MKNKKELTTMIQKKYGNMTGLIVQRNGEILYEQYFNGCNQNSPIHIYSVTKSIISILIGIAIDKGYIESVNQTVLSFFPEFEVPVNHNIIETITIKDLLTMSAPYTYRIAPYIKYFTSTDYVKFSLNLLGGKKENHSFFYTPLIGPDILSGILVRVTGQSVFDFAHENLFCPLGFQVEKNLIFNNKEEQMAFNQSKTISGWVNDLSGINTAGWGLSLTTRNLSLIGQLILNDGTFNHQQIVSKRWLEECFSEHNRWKKINKGYGYLWWLIDSSSQIYAALGDGGNTLYVNKRKNLTISMTGLFQGKVKDRLEFIETFIEPFID